MDKLMLFVDGSVDTQSKTGFGSCLVIADESLSIDLLKSQIKVKRFDHTSSTKLELQTLLWVCSEFDPHGKKVMIFTDSQSILGLMDRRERLEENDYQTKNGKRLSNYELYQEFYYTTDLMDCEFIKVQGHQTSEGKHAIDRIFTLVDRASRHALRKFNNELSR